MFDKIYLNVPYEEKDEAKELGAHWDRDAKSWYFVDVGNASDFHKWMPADSDVELTNEQKYFIQLVKEGHNVLVDACIGSGKTTSIQKLCSDLVSSSRKHILYLTYNKLLKEDARQKIVMGGNVAVHNYHSYAYSTLQKAGIPASVSDCIQAFIKADDLPIGHYDLIVIDEYQDIDAEIAEMLFKIRNVNPSMQIVMVGDMSQKIYDKTTLCVPDFIPDFMGKYEFVKFTYCFRINKGLADSLGYAWSKDIVGVNSDCNVYIMPSRSAVDYIGSQNPGDILCLGKRTGSMSTVLNQVERKYPDRYNKSTVYASIRDGDSNITPSKSIAIFTTYDGCKGLEKPICLIFDFTEDYWASRMEYDVNPDILRNIFCVAASRGKQSIIFVYTDDNRKSYEKRFMREGSDGVSLMNRYGLLKISAIPEAMDKYIEDDTDDEIKMNISDMFDFKYKEDIEACYSLLDVECIHEPDTVIDVPSVDGLIDLSPCIGVYQEVRYFNEYNIDAQLLDLYQSYPNRPRFLPSEETIAKQIKHGDRKYPPTIEEKILGMVAFETMQSRYYYQVNPKFVDAYHENMIFNRLNEEFTSDMRTIQQRCSISLLNRRDLSRYKAIVINGRTDVVKNGVIYELKFVSELSHEHFLQLASYLLATDTPEGVLWNTRNNSKFRVRIKDRLLFARAMARAITKHRFDVDSPSALCITRNGPIDLSDGKSLENVVV